MKVFSDGSPAPVSNSNEWGNDFCLFFIRIHMLETLFFNICMKFSTGERNWFFFFKQEKARNGKKKRATKNRFRTTKKRARYVGMNS